MAGRSGRTGVSRRKDAHESLEGVKATHGESFLIIPVGGENVLI